MKTAQAIDMGADKARSPGGNERKALRRPKGETWVEFEKIWQTIADCWHMKVAASAAMTAATFLIGDVTAGPFVALWSLVIVDTITRWMAIGAATLREHNLNRSIWTGIYLAAIDRKINNVSMFGRFQTKALAYLILLIGFNLLDHVIPDRVMGQSIDGMPNAFISTWLAIVELQSIVENLIEMGMTSLSPVGAWLCRKRDKMTGEGQLPPIQSPGPTKDKP